eukprot:TRINITY_DN67850_c11_g1_i1.p1 TRINITY_DN67850_c11_g1~~TRINITY_DN67850_c11_g1_i1.p1  ORF type:complete len:603 (-),score=67.62 TRINITY_DN67850_c11_g1_i1:151-1959(-)
MSKKIGHGTLGDPSWTPPKCVASSDVACRADQGNKIKASEYMDSPTVLRAKMELVAKLIKQSKFLTAYTGAGLSKASGIPDYATKAAKSVVAGPKLKSNFDAAPTYAHTVLVALERAGYLKHYVQQNHDGLPQKAGYPQEKINEIHGAWYDPSNPVVKFSGSLRGDLFSWMEDAEYKVDMCLCLGTSLSGMNADRMADTPAERACKGEKGMIGTVIINLQQTPLDDQSCVRVWAKIDDAFKILSELLGLEPKVLPITIPKGDVFWVPYNADGVKDETVRMEWNLSNGKVMKVAPAEASNQGKKCTLCGKDGMGNYLCQFEKIRRRMGKWWVKAALEAKVDTIPLINTGKPNIRAATKEDQAELQARLAADKPAPTTEKPKPKPAPKPTTTTTTTKTTEGTSSSSTPPKPVESFQDKVATFFAGVASETTPKPTAPAPEALKILVEQDGFDEAAALSALHVSDSIDSARMLLTETESTSSEDEAPSTPSGSTKGALPPYFRVAQAHQVVGDTKRGNTHEWKLYLAEPDDLSDVYRVTYKLHPTFRNPIVRTTTAPFKMKRTGWGTFDVGIKIELHNGQVFTGEHELSFDANGKNIKHTDIKTA